MGAEYVRSYYKVPAKRGMRVIVDGKPGVIVSFLNQYIRVKFDAYPTRPPAICHPTWNVEYIETEAVQ